MVGEERRSRIAEFELRARSMGITDENVVAQKVAIGKEYGPPNRKVRVSELVFIIPFLFDGVTPSWV